MVELESWTCQKCGETHAHEKNVFMWRCPTCYPILKDAAQVQTITITGTITGRITSTSTHNKKLLT